MTSFGTNPLSRFAAFRTTDPREARTRVSSLICPHALHLDHGTRKVDLSWHRAGLGDAEFHWFRYGVPARVDAMIRSSYLVEIPLCGTGITRCGGSTMESRPGLAFVLSPGSRLVTEFSADCARLLLLVPESAMLRQLRVMLGGGSERVVEFEPTIDLRGHSGASLQRTIEFVLTEMESRPAALARGRLMQLEQLLLQTLLISQTNSCTPALTAPAPETEPAYIRTVERYLDVHLARAPTLEEVATACGVSGRTLQEGFRRYRGISASAMLRELKFRLAREALLTGRPGVTTVACVATACGFDELGRFAVEYRRRYAETPSETLRRAVAPAVRDDS